jgi:DNA repair protein RadC
MRHHAADQTQSLLLPVRSVVADAIALDAVAVVLAHNHPSGNPTPSSADYRLTRRLARTLDAVGVRLVEHIVLARDGTVRFRDLGLL